ERRCHHYNGRRGSRPSYSGPSERTSLGRSKYYDRHLTVESLLGNLYGQREYLGEISRSGAKGILEVGTGSGGMAIFLSWLGFEVTSIDIEQGVFDKAQQAVDRLNGKVSLVKADGFKMPFK